MSVPEIFGRIAHSRDYTGGYNILFVVLRRRNCVIDWSRRLPTLTTVNDLAYGVWIVPCYPSNLQQGVDSSPEEMSGRRLPFLYD